MKPSSIAATFILALGVCLNKATGTEAQPNIVVIVADDMGYSDIGCFGSEIPTPNLDRLAKNGLRFTRFYNTARCSPSRASILTGLYPHQAGVGYLTSDNSIETRRRLDAPGYLDNLNDQCITLAEALKPAGYRTYLSGKWHVGQERPHWPVDRGFDRSLTVHRGYHYFNPQENQYARDDQLYQPDPDDFYATDFFTDQALTFLKEHPADQPFFLYLAYTAPHWPIHAPEDQIARFEGKYRRGWDILRKERFEKMRSMGLLEETAQLSPRQSEIPAWDRLSDRDKDIWDRKMAVYAAQISIMDQGIGRVVERLESQGMLDNTLILFLADNGGCAENPRRGDPNAPIGSPESWRSYGAWATLSNTPFRLFKHYAHEGGIRSSFIAHWPQGITAQQNSFVRKPTHIIDLMPTCLEAAGTKYPSTFKGKPVTPTPGKSLLPYFKGENPDLHDTLYWEHEGNQALLEGDWKLVLRLGGDWELYRVDQDPSELNNLAQTFPERVAQLSAKWQIWADEVGVVPWSKSGRFPQIPNFHKSDP